jgi:hypothetical protein
MSWPADTLLCQRMEQSSAVDAGQVAMQMQMGRRASASYERAIG